MIDRKHAVYTQVNNVVGTLNLLYAVKDVDPNIHLVKLGTMGEYGAPNIDIEEGYIEIPTRVAPMSCPSRSRRTRCTTSRRCTTATTSSSLAVSGAFVRPTSTRESSTDSRRAETLLHPDLLTRWDYDGVFGTVLNRFAAQAVVGYPLTVYGKGGQTRAMLDIRDTLACIEIACINPADTGEFRVFNQFTESF